MGNIILVFLKGLIEDIVKAGGFIDTALNFTFDKLAHNTFYIEDSLGFEYGSHFDFDVIMGFIMGFAIILIILKFLKKGFDAYIAWTDDPASDPLILTTNLLKSLVVALSFPILYETLVEVVEDLTTGLVNALSLENVGINFWGVIMDMIASGGLTFVIFVLIFIILFLILYIKFLMRAAELFIIRVGFPLACVGIMDANGGVFTGYLNKLFQAVLSVTVQLVLAKISIMLILGTHVIWAIVFAIIAITSPNILRELIYNPGGGGMSVNTIYYTTQMIRGMLKK